MIPDPLGQELLKTWMQRIDNDLKAIHTSIGTNQSNLVMKATKEDVHKLENSLEERLEKIGVSLESRIEKILGISFQQLQKEQETLQRASERLEQRVSEDHDSLTVHNTAIAAQSRDIERIKKVVIEGNGSLPLTETSRRAVELGEKSLKLSKETAEKVDRLLTERKSKEAWNKRWYSAFEGIFKNSQQLVGAFGFALSFFGGATRYLSGSDLNLIIVNAGAWVFIAACLILIIRKHTNGESGHNNLNPTG